MNRVLRFLCVFVVALAMVSTGRGAELAQTGERMVNTHTPNNQQNPSVASDAAGNFVVVWEGYYQKENYSTYSNIYGQRFNAAGTPLGSEFLINTPTDSQHLSPAVAMEADGDFLVAWWGYSGIHARRYNAFGEPFGDEFVVNGSAGGSYPSVAMNAGGDFVIVWSAYDLTGTSRISSIYGQRYNAVGERVGGVFQSNTTSDISSFFPSVAMGESGAFVVAWQKRNSTVLARRYSVDGVAQEGEFTVGAGTAASTGMDAQGNFVIAWVDLPQGGSNYGVVVQRYNAMGIAQGGVIRVNSYTASTQGLPDIAMMPSGNFATVWNSYGQDGDDYGVYARRFLADGTSLGDEFCVNTTTANGQFISRNQAVDIDANGNLVIAWTSYSGNPTASYDSYVTKFLVPPTTPNISTQAVTDVAATAATLNAAVHPGGAPTAVEFFHVFQDGRTLLGTVEVPAGGNEVHVSKTVTGLSPHTVYSVQAVATNSVGTTEGNLVSFATANRPPVAVADYATYTGVSLVVEPLANDTDEDGDTLVVQAATAYSGTVVRDGNVLTFTPDATFDGEAVVDYIVTDGRALAGGKVFIRSAIPITRSFIASGKPVTIDTPYHTELVFPSESLWSGVGLPSLMDAGGSLGWLGSAAAVEGKVTGIFSGKLASRQVLHVKVGDLAGDGSGKDLGGLRFAAFKEPVFGADGSGNGSRYAFQARLSGPGVTKATDYGVWVNGPQRPLLIAREGGDAPGVTAGKFASFISLAMPNGSGLFVVATLQHRGKVTAANDLGLWTWTEATGLRLALREGSRVEVNGVEQKVKSFKVLTSVPGSAGHSRTSAQQSLVYGVITFAGGKQAAVSINDEGEFDLHALTLEPHPSGVVPVTFGIPDMASGDLKPIVTASLKRGVANVTPASNVAILDYGGGVVAQKGDMAPGLEKARFRSFKDPVSGLDADNRTISAFLATVTGGGKTSGTTGIWTYSQHDEAVELIAQDGASAPGTDGYFAAFHSLAMVPKRGPLFTASLRRQGKAITAANDLGLWATDSTGAVCLLAREGSELIVGGESKVLKRFDVLQSVSGSPGQGRATSPGDTKAQVIYRAEFADGSQGIVCVTVP